jgi:hypothetical protein
MHLHTRLRTKPGAEIAVDSYSVQRSSQCLRVVDGHDKPGFTVGDKLERARGGVSHNARQAA